MGHDATHLSHPRREELALPAVLHALSDPVRLEIVRCLSACGDERRCSQFDVPVTKSTLTHHFRVLRDAGIIWQRQEGTARLTRLRTEDIEARFPGVLEPILRAAPRGSESEELVAQGSARAAA